MEISIGGNDIGFGAVAQAEYRDKLFAYAELLRNDTSSIMTEAIWDSLMGL